MSLFFLLPLPFLLGAFLHLFHHIFELAFEF